MEIAGSLTMTPHVSPVPTSLKEWNAFQTLVLPVNDPTVNEYSLTAKS